MAFKLRSGNSPLPFKQMGSTPSPLTKTYRQAYDAQSDEKKSRQTYEQFETAAKAWNKKKYGTTEPTRDGNVKAAAAAKTEEKPTPQGVTSTQRPDGGYDSTVSYAVGEGETVNKDRPYDAAIDSKSTPKAEPTKKEARVAKRTERQEARTERKDTRRQAKDMKKVNKLVARDDKRKARDLKRNFDDNPYDAAVNDARRDRLGSTGDRS